MLLYRCSRPSRCFLNLPATYLDLSVCAMALLTQRGLSSLICIPASLTFGSPLVFHALCQKTLRTISMHSFSYACAHTHTVIQIQYVCTCFFCCFSGSSNSSCFLRPVCHTSQSTQLLRQDCFLFYLCVYVCVCTHVCMRGKGTEKETDKKMRLSTKRILFQKHAEFLGQ